MSMRWWSGSWSQTAMSATLTCVGALGLGATALLWNPRPVAAQANTDMYVKTVQPILSNNCYKCHAGESHRGGLKLDSKAAILRGGKDGAVIVPGHPEQSLLVALIRHEGPADDPMPMPPKGKISDADIAAVTAWIKAGAVMPD
jgi:mono/diheme cytochrome c family protein